MRHMPYGCGLQSAPGLPHRVCPVRLGAYLYTARTGWGCRSQSNTNPYHLAPVAFSCGFSAKRPGGGRSAGAPSAVSPGAIPTRGQRSIQVPNRGTHISAKRLGRDPRKGQG